MSAPQASAGEASSSQCACTNISLMQLFHELKQKFPGVPDHVVSTIIGTHCHDKAECEIQLQAEVKASLTHAYHASSVAGARQSAQRNAVTPIKCRNQNIHRHDLSIPSEVKTEVCASPQNATISINDVENKVALNKDILVSKVGAVNTTHDTNQSLNGVSSPITVNIDNCATKNTLDTPSDVESIDVIAKIQRVLKKDVTENNADVSNFIGDSNTWNSNKHYKILKSGKVKSNLHTKLEGEKEKKLIFKSPEKESSLNSEEEVPSEKPKRPCTLEFVKQNPELYGFEVSQPTVEIKSEIPKTDEKNCEKTQIAGEKKSTPNTSKNVIQWQEQPYPVNLSVNVNCHMDMHPSPSRPTRLSLSGEPWAEEYSSPRAFTSVNLTVHTPTSNVQSPTQQIQTIYAGSPHEDAHGFEGHVTVTVSPSGGRPHWRKAPPPPTTNKNMHLLNPSVVEASSTTDSLVSRQRARMSRLSRELGAERARLASVARERAVLAAPPPSPEALRRLRSAVANLRARCHHMARQLDQELTGEENQADNEFYSNIYTGQSLQNPAAQLNQPRAPAPPPIADDEPSWQCHVCTFRNHGLLNACEECTMPRIVLGTIDSQHDTIDSGIASLNLRPTYEQRLENDRLVSSESVLATDSDSLWTNARACERV